MSRIVLRGVLGAVLGISLTGMAQARCTRPQLGAVVNRYLSAQGEGNPALMPLAASVHYVQNDKPLALNRGILRRPLKIAFHRSLLDTATCQTFTDVIVTNPAHPYVLGVRLGLRGHKISQIQTIVTQTGDWLFSAANDLKDAPKQNWSVIPKDQRNTRKQLIAAANAYFNLFDNKRTKVPWGRPCRRLEGGMLTGKGLPTDTCNVGVPSGLHIVDRHFVVDPAIGGVVGLVRFGKHGLPDAHMFRVFHGKIRAIQTLTVCNVFNCGFPLPQTLIKQEHAPHKRQENK